MTNDRNCVYLNMPAETTDAIAKKILCYRTMNCVTKKIENVPLDEVEDILKNMKQEITFINRVKRFGMIEVKFVNEETAQGHALQNIKTEKWWIFPLYQGRRLTRIRIGALERVVKIEWIIAAKTKGIKDEHQVLNANRKKIFNWWGGGAEIFLALSEPDFRSLPHVIVCNGRKLNIVIEGRPPLCYKCNKTGHVKKNT